MVVTIKDVAKMSGVSISTVSRVINNSKPVSSDIRDRVLKVIKETGYVPNPVARSLVTKKSNMIGVIVPDISNMFIADLLNGVEDIGRMYDYDIVLCTTYGDPDKELKYINLLKSKQAAGIILVTGNVEQSHVDAIEISNIPAVYISKNAKDFDVFSVSINHFDAAYEMTKFLLDKGKDRISFIRASAEDNIEDSERYQGFKKALEESGRELDKSLVLQGDETVNSGYALTKKLIDEKNLPQAIFASGDEMAIGVVDALLDNNIKIPEEVSVAGYDDTRIASMIRPSLTTVKQPIFDMGAVSARIIVKLIANQHVEQKNTVLPYSIVERQST